MCCGNSSCGMVLVVQREAIQEGLKEEVIGNSVLQIQQYFREIQSTVRVQADERTMAAGCWHFAACFWQSAFWQDPSGSYAWL